MEEENEKVLKGLSTMLPLELHHELTDFCKQFTDSFGKWSYTVGLRVLLDNSKVVNILAGMDSKIDELSARVASLEDKPKEKKKVKTLGGEI